MSQKTAAALTDYDRLSIRDLIVARDFYHVLLMKHPNVTATAIGLYRIRKKDSWPTANGPGKNHFSYARSLANSEVRPYSWPAILVFVDNWQTPVELARNPGALVPKTLYLPDGRGVPVCIIQAPKEQSNQTAPRDISYPLNNIGGGWPVIADVQNRKYLATIACLVTDGHKTYGLTNHHVTGEDGEVLYSKLGGDLTRIGKSSGKFLTRLPFEKLYDGWPGRDLFVNLDVGLIEADDINQWTAKIRKIGEMGKMVDLSSHNITLKLLGNKVRGVGAASGDMSGEIAALFYRYKTNGGFEYVADALIGPRSENQPLVTHPGDSGTLWLLEQPLEPAPQGAVKANAPDSAKVEYLPVAMQWGRNLLNSAGNAQPQTYVLTTFLSRVCAEIGVDPVRNWNLDQTDTWGALGHFSIAAHVKVGISARNPKLAKLVDLNSKIISHDDAEIIKGDFTGMGTRDFVALADVPDFYWKPKLSKQGFARQMEGPNHFADMDQPNAAGKTLLDLCRTPAFIDPDKWNDFYEGLRDLKSGEKIETKHRGLLPFRVWQIFDDMVESAKKGKMERFVCAAGVLTHYLGDACQPLHISYLHNGDPLRKVEHTITRGVNKGQVVAKLFGDGVHSAYEDAMLQDAVSEILASLKKTRKTTKEEMISNGSEAAQLTISLMRRTFTAIAPIDIVEAFATFNGRPKERAAHLWSKFRKKTLGVMQDGTHTLAVLWESAWEAGNGETTMPAAKALTQKKAMAICQDENFLPSKSINQIGAILRRPA